MFKKLLMLALLMLCINGCMFNTDMSGTLYVRAAAVYEGNADQRFYFTKAALMNNSSFIGDPVLMGHDWINPNAAVGIITHTALRYDSELKSHYIEMVFEIKDGYAAHKIKQGLFNKLSIGFSIDKMVCSIDGKDMRNCEHDSGHYYNVNNNIMLARGIVIRITGQEVSFVNVPASANARILEWSNKPFTTSK